MNSQETAIARRPAGSPWVSHRPPGAPNHAHHCTTQLRFSDHWEACRIKLKSHCFWSADAVAHNADLQMRRHSFAASAEGSRLCLFLAHLYSGWCQALVSLRWGDRGEIPQLSQS